MQMPPVVSSSIVNLVSELVRIPSRAGTDSYDPVLGAVSAWLTQNEIPHEFVALDDGRRVGVWGRLGAGSGRCYLLNATVDTAVFGDESRWTFPPLSAARADGWLYGRGSGDSKAGVAIFCHVLREMKTEVRRRRGSVGFVFDAAEHTGEFHGIRRFMEEHGDAMQLAGAMVGYPGHDRVSVGGRGFERAVVHVHGVAAHTGSARRPGVNAVWRAARIIEAIQTCPLPKAEAGFPYPPRFSVTSVNGGSDFSVVPDLCTLRVDCRLTPAFDGRAARALVARCIAESDQQVQHFPLTRVEWLEGWPAYALDANAPIVEALRGAGKEVLGRDLPAEVVGPSSVANYLAARKVPATNGFGVRCENIHATDERMALDTVEPVFEVYRRALGRLLDS